ncbi:hypothetical protein SCNRRL3882_3714 [Streptomyces chartreusis NRRL 3882]|uniref:Uncharacterized protein n=1 Tax=Streptomyces chartreusis NRRL 3882 TaxID=1079985 RepID=A0A2N9BA77_STRCX|nr:hypothetical protein SCNRRL3882_3714 [Streptomyces chartreusis NRRL 3882]
MRGPDLLRNTAPRTTLAGNHRYIPVFPRLSSSPCNKWPGGDRIPPDPSGGEAEEAGENGRGGWKGRGRAEGGGAIGYFRPIASQADLYFAVQMSDSL